MSRRRELPLNRRNQIVRAATDAGVAPEEVDRAIILGQLAHVLAQHPRIGKSIAYKGGAVMRLIDGSPRYSADLDASAVLGREINREWVQEALATELAQKVLLVPPVIQPGHKAWVLSEVRCHAIGGRPPIVLRVSLNWSEALCDPPEWRAIRHDDLPEGVGTTPVMGGLVIPVMSVRERVAEKLRAFLVRARVGDAFDLAHYGDRVLAAADWRRVAQAMPVKLAGARRELPDGLDLEARFDEQLDAVGQVWPGQMVVRGPMPAWDDVDQSVRRYRSLLPTPMPP